MSSSPHRIALVENDLPTNRALARLLRAHGYAVDAFVSAEQLLTLAPGATFDCLLLDIDLDGMSGLALQEMLVHQGDRTPVIFITGRDHPEARQRATRLGCSSFLCKPVSSALLVAAIRSATAGLPLH
ncbi:response regulator [Massilia sp. CF038]|uniref:response regulator n=1 Tax=Massilia sp. CF038 TaxID=1881045 RepID=UPI00091A0369|nr:response regulator [Massilia sp. CF038]SHG62513.1 Response regulator receiver domain-containing protein [Massilia sp. CF038]